MPTQQLLPQGSAAAPAPRAAADVVREVQAELDAQRELRLIGSEVGNLDKKWASKTKDEPGRFIRPDFTINPEALANFRRMQVFIPDTPCTDYGTFNPRNLLDGLRRGDKKMLKECFETLKEYGHLELLRKYPPDAVGNPHVFEHEGCRLTLRWHKHIHFLGLWKKYLENRLAPDYTGMDIGSSYGIYSSLLKRERPQSRHILVDFPEQLLLARYFLGSLFPRARFAGVRELKSLASIPRGFVESYDFILVPCSFYEKIERGAVDLVTNYASLGEMRRDWFNVYVKGAAFRGAKYFQTANRFESWPTYDTDLTIFDYPILDPAKKIYFGASPVFSRMLYPVRRLLFLYERRMFPPYFDYIGEI